MSSEDSRVGISQHWQRYWRWKAIKWAMKRPAPSRIPLSGIDRLKGRNYYSTYLGDSTDPEQFLITRIDDYDAHGYLFTPGGQRFVARIRKRSIHNGIVAIRHYYKDIELLITGTGLFLFINTIFYYKYAYILEKISQHIYNSRRLVRRERLSVLAYFFRRSIEEADFDADPIGISNEFYGNRWHGHPGGMEIYRYYETLLESLVQSGDLRRVEGRYRLLPQAALTLSESESEDRRHAAAIAQQRLIGVLTAVLAIVGMAQAFLTWLGLPVK